MNQSDMLQIKLMSVEEELSDLRERLLSSMDSSLAAEKQGRLRAEQEAERLRQGGQFDTSPVEAKISALGSQLSAMQTALSDMSAMHSALADLATSIKELRDRPQTEVLPAPAVAVGEMVFNVRRDMEGRIHQVVLQE
jgi:hypothetical protein